MGRHVNLLIIFVLVTYIISLAACTENKSFASDSGVKAMYVDSLLLRWREDSLGCQGYRSKNTLELLLESNSGKFDKEQLIDFLGKPNKIYQNEKYDIMEYYFNTTCKNEVIVDSIDLCYGQILTERKTGKFVKKMYLCE